MKHAISMSTILEAIKHYESCGYKLIDVPQCVSFEASQLTKPKGVPELFHCDMDVYVASAEQSFIQLYIDGKLPDGKYMAITPCYRHEGVLDDLHYSMFLKLELIVIGEEDSYNVMKNALKFFNRYLSVIYGYTDEAKDSFDIYSCFTNDEVGSYGVRYMPDGKPYTYGTGIAEPRFSTCINKESTYHANTPL